MSVQRCTSGPGVLFALAVDEGNTDDQVFNGQNVILSNIILWEIADLTKYTHGYDEDGQNVITCQNCQGCAQFVADQVLHSNNRFQKCTIGGVSHKNLCFISNSFASQLTDHSFSFLLPRLENVVPADSVLVSLPFQNF